ncbi:helical backbone metal receptor [Gramella lutea]|uniref:Helical backbone metal receptor n=1 Tax=Christiangramia lutea TaxID=1607951 RepID=A0A9X1V017_9FLAO|nr:helical backbone metal receptor [Christiangramia lutea]
MEFQDQLGRKIELKEFPKRIISLVPSQTELLVDLGLEEYIVGITHYCVHPEYLKKVKTSVGGTKKVNMRKLRDLEPDIILCNKEENTKEMVQELEKVAPVHVSEVKTLHDAYHLMEDYGKIFHCEELAEVMINSMAKKAENLKHLVKDLPKRKVVYFIWNKPLMAAGQGTFINEMLQLNNFENFLLEERYPETNFKELMKSKIDICLLSTEPFPFTKDHKKDFKKISEKVELVNGEYFSWYGSRLLEAMEYFKRLHS